MTAPATSPTAVSPAAPLRARRPRGRTAGALALLLAAGCLLGTGPAAAVGTGTAARTPGARPLSWGACPAQEAGPAPVTRDPRQQCADLTVPLDYRAPRGRRVRLVISRIRSGAAHPTALMIGQGGPGFGGLDLPSAAETDLPAQVTERTDLYGLDYRGIGASSPLHCDVAPADRTEDTGIPYPAADGSIAADAAWAQRVAADCAAHAGAELPYVNTANIARDIDRVRTALGLRTLSYTGTSYGSYVGEVYATLFPATSGRVLLNSVVPPGGVKEAIEHKGQAVDRAFEPFAAWAAARDGDYHLGSTAAAVRGTDLATARELNAHPIPLSDPNRPSLTGNLLLEAQEVLLEQTSYYPELAALLTGARTGAFPPGTGSGFPGQAEMADDFVSAQDAVVCNDTVWPRDLAHYRAAVTRDAARYPLTAGSPRNVWPCAFWATPTSDRAPAPSPRGPANILLVQNTADPSTPVAGARQTLRAFGHRAAMVTVDAAGHGVDTSHGCVAAAVTRFLIQQRPPRSGTCPAAD